MTIINCTLARDGQESDLNLIDIDLSATNYNQKKKKKSSLIILGNNCHNLITQPHFEHTRLNSWPTTELFVKDKISLRKIWK